MGNHAPLGRKNGGPRRHSGHRQGRGCAMFGLGIVATLVLWSLS